MKRFISQTGMGDAIFTLPLAMAHEAEKIEAVFYTAMPELFAGLEYVKGEKVPPWDSEANRNFDGTRLKYDRYRGSYFDSYYLAHGMKTDLVDAQEMAALHLGFKMDPADQFWPPDVVYVVAGWPRLPARHKAKKQRGDEGNYGAFALALAGARQSGYAIAAVGQDEVYEPEPDFKTGCDLNLNDVLSFRELMNVVESAEYVVSQVSFLTALAGCLGTPVKYIPGAKETPERFARHVEGVTWKKNLRPEAVTGA